MGKVTPDLNHEINKYDFISLPQGADLITFKTVSFHPVPRAMARVGVSPEKKLMPHSFFQKQYERSEKTN